jgi:tetratricopeptide (TPR) repeat protein
MTDCDRTANVKRKCAAIADRVSFDADLSGTPISELSCAIVFIHAFWSVPSVQRLIGLADTVASVDPSGRLRVIVCDIDNVSHLAGPYNIDITGGYGEILWVHDGSILARYDPSRQCDIRHATAGLAARCQACSPPTELEKQARQLKQAGRYSDALLLRLEFERRQIEAETPNRDRARNLNWIAYLAVQTDRFSVAARAARKCLELYAPTATANDPVLASYTFMLAAVLAEARQFDEAVAYGETAIRLFSESGHDAAFLEHRRADVARMRNGDTQPYLERSYLEDKLNWEDGLSELVVARLRSLLSDRSAAPLIREAAKITNALPVYGDLGGILCISRDGRVLCLDNSGLVTVVTDDFWRIVAAVSAAEKYPELSAILPERPPGAKPCSDCSGFGKFMTSRAFCGKCRGLGWVE